MSRKGLGRGLDALIPEIGPVEREQIQAIPVARIRPNPKQPRKEFEPEALEELAASIRQHGLVQPVLVRPADGDYELVAGERRWRAAQLAGLESIPAVVRDVSPAQAMEIALIENLQREDLNPLEQAEAYRTLLEEHGLSHDELARRLGKSRPQITNTLRLLNLAPGVREAVATGALSMGHAKVLLSIENPRAQEELAARAANEGWSVRTLERELERRRQQERGPSPRARARQPARSGGDPDLAGIEARLREHLGTPVRIHAGSPRGRIEIHFFGTDDLNRLVELILGRQANAERPLDRPARDPFPI